MDSPSPIFCPFNTLNGSLEKFKCSGITQVGLSVWLGGKRGQSFSEAQLVTQNNSFVPDIHVCFHLGGKLPPLPFFFINIRFSGGQGLGRRTGKCGVKGFPPNPLLFSSLSSQIQELSESKVKLAWTSLVVQQLRLHVPSAGGPGSIPGQGNISCMPQLKKSRMWQRRSHVPQLRPGAAK